VGLVVKYADNILKNFANALSVVLTVLGAVPLFGQWPSSWFLAGVGAVLLSVSMYSGAGPGMPGPVVAGMAALAKAHPGLARAAGDVATALGLAKPASGSHAHAPAGAARRAARIRVCAGMAVLLGLVVGAGVVSRHAGGGGGGGSAEVVGASLGRRAGFGAGSLTRGGGGGAVPADPTSRPATLPGDSDGDLSRSGPQPEIGDGGGGDSGDGGGGRRAVLSSAHQTQPVPSWELAHRVGGAWGGPARRARRARRAS